MVHSAKLKTITPNAEADMAYIARVSNPKNQDNPSVAGLLKYCIKHSHWSVFEHAHMTIEIDTTRAISPQILRHQAKYQEFSQRYSSKNELGSIELPELRMQDLKNRQNSIEGLSQDKKLAFEIRMQELFNKTQELYDDMLNEGVAKECARNILPMCSPTRMYMTNNIRNWIHYIQLREKNGTQKEHMLIARACKEIFKKELPIVSEALGWNE